MNCIHNSQLSQQYILSEAARKSAIHEAGYVIALLSHEQKNRLSDSQYQIIAERLRLLSSSEFIRFNRVFSENYSWEFPWSSPDHIVPFSPDNKAQRLDLSNYKKDEEIAEILISILFAGPLAEAKYVALSDGELINAQLINMEAMKNYNGTSNLEIINSYLDAIHTNDDHKNKKKHDLYLNTFLFVNERRNWLAITAAAELILLSKKRVIEFDEIKEVISHLKY